MLTAMLQRARRLATTTGVDRLLRGTGLGQALLSRYERRVLNAGVHSSSILGHKLRFAVKSRIEITHIDMNTEGEVQFMSRLLTALQERDTFYDVGANIGIVSLLAATAKKHLQVHAFEPDAHNATRISANSELNCTKIEVHQNAVGHECGHAEFHLSESAGAGTHSLVASPLTTGRTTRVDMITLDHAAECFGPPDVVKIDVEGAEMFVLRGATALLRSKRIRDLFVEVHPERLHLAGSNESALCQWVEQLGYVTKWTERRSAETMYHFSRLS